MLSNAYHLAPRFQVGDNVIVTLAGMSQGKQGVVRQIIEQNAEKVCWYRVRFADGDGGMFFAFELKPRDSEPAS